jgi:hypothetical protein
MGGGSFDHAVYASVSATRATKSVSAIFVQAAAEEIHKDLDPKDLKVRESCDSPEHPNSNALGIWFDQTGSMATAPTLFAKEKLGGLMKILLAKGYIDDPQILFGCFGDFSDRIGILQMGQFESDQRIDDCLTKMWLVGGGGGTHSESAELAFYAMARHTKLDCFDKRGKKGYMFLVTDEKPYSVVSKHQVEAIFGEKIEGDIKVEDILAELQERYEVFVVFLHTSCYPSSVQKAIRARWKELLGERVLDLEDPANICETIGATVGLLEGRDVDGITRDLIDLGSSPDAIRKAVKATALVVAGSGVAGGALAKATVTGGNLPAVSGSGGGTERL